MGNCTSNDPKVGVADATKPIDRRAKNLKQTNQNGFKPIQLKNTNQPNGNTNPKSNYPETTSNFLKIFESFKIKFRIFLFSKRGTFGVCYIVR